MNAKVLICALIVLALQVCFVVGGGEYKSTLMNKIQERGASKSPQEMDMIIKGYLSTLDKEDQQAELAKLQEDINDLRNEERRLDEIIG